jgi:hypothetical protein
MPLGGVCPAEAHILPQGQTGSLAKPAREPENWLTRKVRKFTQR